MRKVALWMVLLIMVWLPVNGIAQKADIKTLTIYEALQLAERNEVGDFLSAIRFKSSWEVKGVNLNNHQSATLRINIDTGIIEYCQNVLPKNIYIDENTYGYSGKLYPKDAKFYKKGMVSYGFEIYGNDDRIFKMRKAIFIIQNTNQFACYQIYQGPDVIKGGGEKRTLDE